MKPREAVEGDDVPAELLYPGGILGYITDYIERSKVASVPMLNLMGAITLLGTVAGQKVMTETELRTNFYCVGLAGSGTGKDAPISAISGLLEKSEARKAMGPDSPTSAAAILRWIENGARACSLLLLDEMGLQLKGMKNPNGPGAEIPQTLMQLFTSTDRAYRKSYASSETLIVPWHHVSIYGVSTPLRFWESLGYGEATDGFLARILVYEYMGKAPKRKQSEHIPVPQHIVDALNEIWALNKAGNTSLIPQPTMVEKTPEAAREFEAWEALYHELQNEYLHAPGGKSAIYSRAAEHAHKLALVHAISRCGATVVTNKVDTQDVRWAMSMVDYLVPKLVQRVAERVADNPQEALCKDIIAVIKRTATPAKPGATMRDLLRKTCKQKKVVEMAIDTLVAREEIMFEDYKPARGRPGRLYRMVTDDAD